MKRARGTQNDSEGGNMTDRKRRAKPKAPKAKPEKREPTRWEREAFPDAIARQAAFAEPAAVAIDRIGSSPGFKIDATQSDIGGHTALLGCALGSRSEDWVRKSVSDLMSAAGVKNDSTSPAEATLVTNAALAFMSDIAPRNTVEAAIGINAFAAHEMTMLMMQRARGATMLPGMQAYGNLASKMSLRFIEAIEALAKLRRGGEQIVKHVHVHEGGQAVVADTFNHNGGGTGAISRSDDQSDAAAAFSAGTALPGPDASGLSLSVSGNAERPLSHARRDESGGTSGQ